MGGRGDTEAAGVQPLPLPPPKVPGASDPLGPPIVSTCPRDCPGQAPGGLSPAGLQSRVLLWEESARTPGGPKG